MAGPGSAGAERHMSQRAVESKVGVVGTGMVGSSFAYALMQRGLANELVLLDADPARAEGEAMDLGQGLAFVRPMRIVAGSYADLAGAAVIVVCAGLAQRPGQTRLELGRANAAVVRDVVPRILAVNGEALIVVATNPVDILTQIAADLAGPERRRVLGAGTALDTARLRYLLGDHYGVDPRSVHAFVVGEHGDSELALWSLANVAGVRLERFVGTGGQGYDPAALQRIFEQTRNAAYEIIKRKKATYYAIGLGLLSIVEAVLRDQRTVMTVSSPLSGQYGIRDIALSMPSIVGRRGVEQVLDVPLSEAESAALRSSAQALGAGLAEVR
jgi:L-lactate dehydrogenase